METVSVDRVKPVHFKREPEAGTTTQRQLKPKPKYTTSKPAAISHKPRKVRARSSSTTRPTLKSFKTGDDTNTSTQTRSLALGIGMSPAIALQSAMTRAHLPRPPTVYKAPHSRTTTVSRTNRDSGSFQTYLRIPLHLRGNALGRTETKRRLH